jgi:exonuclease SbcD
MLRLLHTSDWHLGVSSGPVSRAPDHTFFLSWLLEALEREAIDVLVIAGDVFDAMHPSAEALRQYYGFLRAVGSTGVRDVVVVGGNHDSPSRLDAPAEVLGALDVHVVGGLSSDPDTWERCVVPVRARGSDDVAGVVLAVPYVHEFRLGVRSAEVDRETARTQLHQRFTGLYQQLTDLARERHEGVPVVATGHLTAGPATRDDYPQEIHQVAVLDAMPAEVFDPRLRYVALGHVHRSYPVIEGRAWYCGSPIPMTILEAQTRRRVLRVDVEEGEDAVIEPLLLPVWRELHQFDGSAEGVEKQLSRLTSTAPLPPLVRVRVRLSKPDPDLSRRLHAAVDTHAEAGRPVLVEIRQVVVLEETKPAEGPPPPLDTLTVSEVFDRLLAARGIPTEDPVRNAFDTLCSATSSDFEALVAEAER